MHQHRWHRPVGSTAREGHAAWVDPESAGWEFASLRVLELDPGGARSWSTADSEWIVLPLSGGCIVHCEGRSFALTGRASVFTGVTDFAYVPRDAEVRLTSDTGGRFALAGARCERRLPARYQPASEVPVKLRGAGASSRQVNDFGAADAFEAERLIALEVLTPSGNWSSFPPHKHDDAEAGETRLEEICYFELSYGGLGYQRVYPSASDGGTDVLAEVRSGDVVLVPDGWHGPSMAVPGYDMYCLNVLAGPSTQRASLTSDDPAHGWVRGIWESQVVDPRLPMYTAPEGRR